MTKITFNENIISLPKAIYTELTIEMFKAFYEEETLPHMKAMFEYGDVVKRVQEENSRRFHEWMALKWWQRLFTKYPEEVKLVEEYSSLSSKFHKSRERYNDIYGGVFAMMYALSDGLDEFVYDKQRDPYDHFENYLLKFMRV